MKTLKEELKKTLETKVRIYKEKEVEFIEKFKEDCHAFEWAEDDFDNAANRRMFKPYE